MAKQKDEVFVNWNGIDIPVLEWDKIDHSLYKSETMLYEEGYSVKDVKPSVSYYSKSRKLQVFLYDIRKCRLRKKQDPEKAGKALEKR